MSNDLIPVSFQFGPSVDKDLVRHNTITIETRDGFHGRKWCIKRYGNCLGRDGEWEYEMQPSSRTDAFYARCRWDSLDEAADFLREWWNARTPRERLV